MPEELVACLQRSLKGAGQLFAAPATPAAAVVRAVLRLQGFRQLFVALFVMPEERKVSRWLGVVSDLPLSMPACIAGAQSLRAGSQPQAFSCRRMLCSLLHAA